MRSLGYESMDNWDHARELFKRYRTIARELSVRTFRHGGAFIAPSEVFGFLDAAIEAHIEATAPTVRSAERGSQR